MNQTVKKDIASKTVLWISLAYVLSFICYIPMLLNKYGVNIPNAFLNLKYGFIFVPALVSVLFLIHERRLKNYWIFNFKKISLKEIVLCVVVAVIGVAVTYCYALIEKADLFGNAYSSVLSLVVSCLYLFATALIEEIAWRGYLFSHLAVGEKKVTAAIFVGVVWATWHIPMWLIRNSLSSSEMIPLFIWAVLVSVVLGMSYSVFRNILSVSILHMIFNVCFLAPVKCNVLIIFLSIMVCFVYKNTKQFLEKRKMTAQIRE